MTLIRNAKLISGEILDIAMADGRITAMAPALPPDPDEFDAAGALAFPGFVETHIHLDKACILDRCHIDHGTLPEAIIETARAKAAFTEADVQDRAAHVIRRAILAGTTRMRSFVEVDPRAGLRSLDALLRLRQEFAFAIDLELCAFAQEGLTNEPETYDLLDQALLRGADLVGGCPYADPDPVAHIEMIFDLASRHDVDVDFHLDFDLDPSRSSLPTVIALTLHHGWQGRVTVGHVTKLSAMQPDAARMMGRRLMAAGIAVTGMPATDMFLNGRNCDRLVPRGVAPLHLLAAEGVTCSIATNNVMNPFTPFGDASLLRMANLYANLAQLSRDDDIAAVFGMIGVDAARIMGAAYGLSVGAVADLVLLDCADPQAAVRVLPRVIAGWKRGRQSFVNPAGQILPA